MGRRACVAVGLGVLVVACGERDSVNMPGSCWNAATDRIAYSADPVGPAAVFLVKPDGAIAAPAAP